MTERERQELARLVGERVDIDGEACVVFHVMGTACALRTGDGRTKVASAERVRRAWREDNLPRRDP